MIRTFSDMLPLACAFIGALALSAIIGWWLWALQSPLLPWTQLALGIASAGSWAISASMSIGANTTTDEVSIKTLEANSNWSNFVAALLTAMVAVVGLYTCIK